MACGSRSTGVVPLTGVVAKNEWAAGAAQPSAAGCGAGAASRRAGRGSGTRWRVCRRSARRGGGCPSRGRRRRRRQRRAGLRRRWRGAGRPPPSWRCRCGRRRFPACRRRQAGAEAGVGFAGDGGREGVHRWSGPLVGEREGRWPLGRIISIVIYINQRDQTASSDFIDCQWRVLVSLRLALSLWRTGVPPPLDRPQTG
jgi:hypothetical protein